MWIEYPRGLTNLAKLKNENTLKMATTFSRHDVLQPSSWLMADC